jgi:hypothetical protein
MDNLLTDSALHPQTIFAYSNLFQTCIHLHEEDIANKRRGRLSGRDSKVSDKVYWVEPDWETFYK